MSSYPDLRYGYLRPQYSEDHLIIFTSEGLITLLDALRIDSLSNARYLRCVHDAMVNTLSIPATLARSSKRGRTRPPPFPRIPSSVLFLSPVSPPWCRMSTDDDLSFYGEEYHQTNVSLVIRGASS